MGEKPHPFPSFWIRGTEIIKAEKPIADEDNRGGLG